MKQRSRPLSLFLILFLLLSGCNFPPLKANKLFQSLSQTPTTPAAILPTEMLPTLVAGAPGLPADMSCLIARWQLTNAAVLIGSVLPGEQVAKYNLKVQETRGDFLYTFTADGQLNAQASDFEADLAGNLSGVDVSGVAIINGSASGDYAPGSTPGTLLLSNLVNDGFTATVKVGPLTVVPETPVGGGLGLGASSTGQAELAYTCSNDALRIDVPGRDDVPAQTFAFSRVTP